MGLLRTSLLVASWSSLAASSAFLTFTRKSKVYPLPATDYLLQTALYTQRNPHKAPPTQDICIRHVPLNQIKPEFLDVEGRLTEAFCAGVWSGWGYAYQRRFLEKKYKSDPFTRDHLWDHEALKASTYDIGTKITDHFEVVSKTPQSIIVRAGDSPRVQKPREADGLFEISAEVKKDMDVVEFGLKSVFFNSLNGHETPGKPPMPWFIEKLHQVYDKILMESAIKNVIT